MDNLVDTLLLGLVWWDLSWLTALGVEHSEKLVDYEALAFEHWGAHKSNVQALKYDLEETLDQVSVLETNLINKSGIITEQETKEVVDLTAKVQRLEKELLDEQDGVKREEKTKLVNYIAYPSVIIISAKVTWELAKWFLPSATAMLS
jgi:capsule polysaccharide export protein KpsE/RkpR